MLALTCEQCEHHQYLGDGEGGTRLRRYVLPVVGGVLLIIVVSVIYFFTHSGVWFGNLGEFFTTQDRGWFGALGDMPEAKSPFDRVKFEVDYIKHLCTMCAAAVAFIAGYLKTQDDKPPAWMSSSALAAFIIVACICSLGYALKSTWVVTQQKPLLLVKMDLLFGIITDVFFTVGIVLLLCMCFRPLWGSSSSPNPNPNPNPSPAGSSGCSRTSYLDPVLCGEDR